MGHVIVIDDDRDVLEALEARFTVAGHTITACTSYIEAKDHIIQSFPGCIVSDIRMRGKTGLDVITYAQRIDPELPVIVLTGFAQTETVVKAMRGGATTVLEKPCAMDVLLGAMAEALETRAAVLKTRKTRAKRAARNALGRPSKDRALSPQLAEYEAALIQRALMRNDGDKTKTAKELGISRSQLYAKIKDQEQL